MTFRVRKTDDNFKTWTVADGAGCADSENYISECGEVIDHCETHKTKKQAEKAFALYLHKQCPLKVGDKVRVVADKKRLDVLCIGGKVSTGTIGAIERRTTNHFDVDFGPDHDDVWSLDAQDLELVCSKAATVGTPPLHEQPPIRTFDTGATRDTTQGKLDYVKALSPIVLRRYVQYLDKHRLQPDGSYRDFDNWKKGMDQDVYHSSGGRHFFDTWLLTEGYATEDNHGSVELEDAICAQLFNLMGRLHEMLQSTDHNTPTPGGY